MAHDNPEEKNELGRIQTEYLRRDSLHLSREFGYTNPAFVYHIQEREWAILSLLRKEGVAIGKLAMLEVGCGTGHILERFREFGVRRAIGIDLMEHRIKTGIGRYPGILLTVGSGTALPYPDCSFDLVTQFMCLSSVLDPNIRSSIAKEMLRVLKPGGIILSYDMRTTPAFIRFLSGLYTHLSASCRQNDHCRNRSSLTPTKPLDRKELQKLFDGKIIVKKISLNFKLAAIARTSHSIASIMSLFPWLRTHYLALIHKQT
jgi:ubiquinone/menaquinone biosynthesis C-methylase UbiE